MSGRRYTDEFKVEAVRQVTERGHSVADVASELGITMHSPYAWKRSFDKPAVVQRFTEERDILKKAAAYLAKG